MENLNKNEMLLINGGETQSEAYSWGARVGFTFGRVVGSALNAVDRAMELLL
ncbi:hypothetical protein [Marivirga sp.]|jgi:hypothetical protein|uniref:hypothetical protein n=1 Tax=Marivirga sp. TaxID=2018662 RepID=UPI003DA72B46